ADAHREQLEVELVPRRALRCGLGIVGFGGIELIVEPLLGLGVRLRGRKRERATCERAPHFRYFALSRLASLVGSSSSLICCSVSTCFSRTISSRPLPLL